MRACHPQWAHRARGSAPTAQLMDLPHPSYLVRQHTRAERETHFVRMHTPVRRGTVRRLPRPPPWSPGDDRWLPGTAGARGRCASVTLRRDATDLIKFGAAGGQADGSPIMSFKIGKH